MVDLWPNQRLVFLVLDMLIDRHRDKSGQPIKSIVQDR